jgi:hypothetical protein
MGRIREEGVAQAEMKGNAKLRHFPFPAGFTRSRKRCYNRVSAVYSGNVANRPRRLVEMRRSGCGGRKPAPTSVRSVRNHSPVFLMGTVLAVVQKPYSL